jgi:hypothetical protein
MTIYRDFFSKPGQISLMLRPSAAEPMRAAFFFRVEKCNVVKGIECDVDEWRPGEAEMEPAVKEHIPGEAREPMVAITPAVEREEPVVTPVAVTPVAVAPVAVAPAVVAKVETVPIAAIPEPVPLLRDTRPVAPVGPTAIPDMFAFAGPPPRRKKPFVWIFAAAAVLAAGAAAFFTQDSWLPRPPLALNSVESNGNLVIRWNIDALRGIDRASMFVNDGGNLQSLPLDRFQINQGVLIYSPKSERVTAKLSAGETSAIAVWLKPVAAAPAVEAPTSVADVPQTATPAPDTAKAAHLPAGGQAVKASAKR